MSVPDFAALAAIAARIARALQGRGQTLAIADGASGGLLSAAVLTVPGATGFYRGGGVIYSRRAREVILGIGPRDAAGMRSVTEDYALLQARAVQTQFGADWGLAESGSAGGSVHPGGVGSGQSWAAVAGPAGPGSRFTATASDERMANMFVFAGAALGLLEEALG